VTAARRLAAILTTTVAGYSRLMGVDEEGTLERLKAHRHELGDPKIREHHGRIVKTTGDGMLVEFSSVVDAVRCAAEIQTADAPQPSRKVGRSISARPTLSDPWLLSYPRWAIDRDRCHRRILRHGAAGAALRHYDH